MVLVTGPPRAGVTSMAAALRRRMPSYRFAEADDVGGMPVPVAVVFVASAVAPVVESDCALARNRATGGSGLGLAITKSLIEAHGGTVKVTTAPGEGSTFTISLPAL